MPASVLTRRLTRCFACAAVVLAMLASSSSALAAPVAKKPAKPAAGKVIAKEKAPAARHPWKKAKSAPPKAKPAPSKPKVKPKAGSRPSGAPGPHGDTHPAPLAA